VTFTATVTPATGSATPTGWVALQDSGQTLATGQLNAQGAATFTIKNLSVGTHNFSAVYSGDANSVSSSSDPVTQAVGQASTSTTVWSMVGSSLGSSAVQGQTVTLRAQVTASAPRKQTGTITFMDGTQTLGTASLRFDKMAVLKLDNLSPGDHLI